LALGTSALAIASGLWCGAGGQPAKKTEVKPLQTFGGELLTAKLELLPKDSRNLAAGYFNDAKAFRALWQAWQPNKKVPEIDFKPHFVVYARNVKYFNGLSFGGEGGKVYLEGGTLRLYPDSATSAIPVKKKCFMLAVVIPRAGVKKIGMPAEFGMAFDVVKEIEVRPPGKK
jgi:hypothetical protein